MVAARKFQDPRFDDLAGTFADERFRKQYGFIYDEQLPQEQQNLKASIKVPAKTVPACCCLFVTG